MKPNPFPNKTASPAGRLEAKPHFKRFQNLPTLAFPRPAGADKAPEPAVNLLSSLPAAAPTPDIRPPLNQ